MNTSKAKLSPSAAAILNAVVRLSAAANLEAHQLEFIYQQKDAAAALREVGQVLQKIGDKVVEESNSRVLRASIIPGV